MLHVARDELLGRAEVAGSITTTDRASAVRLKQKLHLAHCNISNYSFMYENQSLLFF